MAATRRFPQFTYFPPEIQLEIWKYHSDNQPALRHCFAVQATGRAYGAFEEASRLFVNQRAKKDDNNNDEYLVGRNKMIRLTGRVEMMNCQGAPYSATRVWSDIDVAPTTRASPAFIYVNFERDVFYFQQSRFVFPGVFTHEVDDTWFRFLYNRISFAGMGHIRDNPWISSVQRVALEVPQTYPYSEFSDCDIEVMTQMTKLKEVFIVAATEPVAKDNNPRRRLRGRGRNHRTPNHTGFVPVAEFKPIPRWQFRYEYNEAADMVHAHLKKFFEARHLKVEVTVVVDAYEPNED